MAINSGIHIVISVNFKIVMYSYSRDGKPVTMAIMKYLNKFSGLHLKSEKLSKDYVLEATI